MTLSPLSGTRYAGDVIQISEWGLQVGRGRGEVFLFQFWDKFILDPSVGSRKKLTGGFPRNFNDLTILQNASSCCVTPHRELSVLGGRL